MSDSSLWSRYKGSKNTLPRSYVNKKKETQTYEVHGEKATNYEYYVALALDKLEIPYIFQLDYLGGRTVSGGFVLDFLALTVPLPTAIWVHGEYWHKGKRATIDMYQELMLKFVMAGKIRVVVLFGIDLQTPEMARVTLKREMLKS